MDPHELAEERSLAIHREVAARLRVDPALVAAARARVEGWLADGSVHPFYARAWHELLAGPAARLLEVLTDPGEAARALRQCSPFAGVVDPRTRWRIWRDVRDRLAT
jgi:hypothetical protein